MPENIFSLPGQEAVALISRREVLRTNWQKLRNQIGQGLAPAVGISKDLFDQAGRAFEAFAKWDQEISTPKEVWGAYEAEVLDYERAYAMIAEKVAAALRQAQVTPTFTVGTCDGKSQDVRLLDVLLIGPLMTYAGCRLYREEPVLGTLLALFGVGTVMYNLNNYLMRKP